MVEDCFGSSAAQLGSARRSGYDLDGDEFRPHITITRFEADEVPAVRPTSNRDLTFDADIVGLLVANDMGAGTSILETHHLTG